MSSAEARILSVKLDSLRQDVGEMKAAMADAVESLSRISLVEQRISDQISTVGVVFSKLDNHSLRISAIEQDMPGLKELRRWVVGGILTGLGMMLLALIKLVIVDQVPSGRVSTHNHEASK